MQQLISWVEIPATNFERAVDFYAKVLKTNFEVFNSDHEKMACFSNGEGAISYSSGFEPSANGVLVSFDTKDDLDGALNRILENGGKIHTQKTKIEAEGREYFALFIDSEGNRVGLHGH
jgi:predicted enzyme related to lactoylglutathione lyase